MAKPRWTEGWGVFEWACVVTTVITLGGILAVAIGIHFVDPPPD